MTTLKNPLERHAERLYQAADELTGDLVKLPALQPLKPGQDRDLFYESLYFLGLVCDKVLVEVLTGRRASPNKVEFALPASAVESRNWSWSALGSRPPAPATSLGRKHISRL